ncbi:AMP-binding protein [Candidatus Thioglobus sp.]|nr:AMP-binding protein [Candidatus Thioglobus sp.]
MFYNLNPTEAPVFIDESGRSISYKDAYEQINCMVDAIGADKKDLAFLYLDQSVSSALAYLSFLNSGQASLLIDSAQNDELKTSLLELYKPRWIWTLDEDIDRYQYAQRNCPIGYLYERIDYVPSDIHSNVAILLSTSGTTGSPKLIRLSFSNLESNAQSIKQYMQITDKDRAITTLPFFYSFGLSVLNSHLAAGARIICTNDGLFDKRFWLTMHDQKITFLAGVPFTFEMLERIRFERIKLPALRLLVEAGGKLIPERVRNFYEIARKGGFVFLVMYGQSEATARIAYVPFEQLSKKTGSIGICIPGGKLWIESNGEKVSDPGVDGELVYQGDNVMMGYACSIEDLSKPDEMKGLLRTGDIAKMDEDGFFYIIGRNKRFIKIAGLRLNLDEIESYLNNETSHPSVVYGEDEILKILVETEDESLANDAKEMIVSRFRLHPQRIQSGLVNKIPRNSSGKIQYTRLEKR